MKLTLTIQIDLPEPLRARIHDSPLTIKDALPEQITQVILTGAWASLKTFYAPAPPKVTLLSARTSEGKTGVDSQPVV